MITWIRRERSACGLERDLVSCDLSLIAANIAGPMGVSVTSVWPFLTQKEVFYPMYLKFIADLPARVLTKIRIKLVVGSPRAVISKKEFGYIGSKFVHCSWE